jgi:DNA (cytosine-5)-methyltransferase 1
MSRLVSNIRRSYLTDESSLSWVPVVEEMIAHCSPFTESVDETLVWAALSHFFVAVTDGDRGIEHLRNVGVERKISGLTKICLANAHNSSSKFKHHKSSKSKKGFRFIDLFAGIGGFHIAMAENGGRPVFVSEWDDGARLTYCKNFGIVPYGDIREFTLDEDGEPLDKKTIRMYVPECDILTAGFPCQPFSLAGVSSRIFHGIEHGLQCRTQGTLFEDVVQIAVAASAKAVLLENVKNLASHDSGRTLPVILSRLRESSFRVFPEAPIDGRVAPNWAVQDSSHVSAQRRKRLYFIAIREEFATKPFVFPVLKGSKDALVNIGEVIKADNSMTEEEKFNHYGISQRLWNSHKRRDKAHEIKGNGFKSGLMTDLTAKAPTLVARYYKDGKDCLIPRKDDVLGKRRPPRMLTPTECLILQTFPNWFELPEFKTPAYKQLGNSITVKVAERITSSLVRYLSLK